MSDASPDFANVDVCPTTGLDILSRPEWTDIDLGEGYSVTFRVIGTNIIYSVTRGHGSIAGVRRLFEMRSKIIEEFIGIEQPYVEVRDFSFTIGMPLKDVRDEFARGLMADQDRLIRFIGINASPEIRLSLNVGRKMYKAPFPISLVTTYEVALKEARYVTEGKGNRAQDRMMGPDKWQIDFNGFSACYEVAGDDVVLGSFKGMMGEEHVVEMSHLHDNMSSVINLEDCYFLVDVRAVGDVNPRVRKFYLEEMLKWHREHPFKKVIPYGLNPLQQAAVNANRHLLPFAVHIVDDYAAAMEFVAADREKAIWDDIVPDAGRNEMQRYADEILEFIGGINWESGGLTPPRLPSGHPFAGVFDALYLIKADLDELLAERKTAEEKVRENEERLRITFEHAPMGIIQTTTAGDFIWANRKTAEICGYELDEIMRLNTRELTHPDDLDETIRNMTSLVSGKRDSFSMEKRYIRKDGKTVWAKAHVAAVRDEAGTDLNHVAIIENITAQREMESLLKQKDEKYRTLLENIRAGYYEVNLKGDFLFFNEAMANIIGYDAEELLGMNYRECFNSEDAGNIFGGRNLLGNLNPGGIDEV